MDTLIKLINPEFEIEFMGQIYTVRKATLDKVCQYQQYVKELSTGGGGTDANLIAQGLYLLLKDKIEGLTIDTVLQNTPGDLNSIEVLTMLGFFPKTSQENQNKKQIGAESSSS